jgi:D-tyrosyl-tRNA(Tyr) deacylase
MDWQRIDSASGWASVCCSPKQPLPFIINFESLFVRAVIQRVTEASVTVDNAVVGQIQRGFMVLLGVAEVDTQDDVIWIAGKIAGLRVFEDADGKMNLALADVGASVLLVSQFTLYGDCRKGRRPSFVEAARPEKANALYKSVAAELRGQGLVVETGTFQTHMDVRLLNDGPVTLLLDSRK